jgi:hypothetical protein
MGDGRTLAQAIRALDKFVAEQNCRNRAPDPDCPVRRAYERIVGGEAAAGGLRR